MSKEYISDIQEIIEQIVQFTRDRDWDQFHNGKDLALALSIEAAELNEAFLWKKPEDVCIEKVKEELSTRYKRYYSLQVGPKCRKISR